MEGDIFIIIRLLQPGRFYYDFESFPRFVIFECFSDLVQGKNFRDILSGMNILVVNGIYRDLMMPGKGPVAPHYETLLVMNQVGVDGQLRLVFKTAE